MLDIKNLSVSYGAIDAVKNISMHVDDGEIVSLIGANGDLSEYGSINCLALLRLSGSGTSCGMGSANSTPDWPSS